MVIFVGNLLWYFCECFFFNRNDFKFDDYFIFKDNELSKKYRNLLIFKCKKKVWYNKVLVKRFGVVEDLNVRFNYKDNMSVS